MENITSIKTALKQGFIKTNENYNKQFHE